MNEDPWEKLTPPGAASAINARRVNAKNPWGFFWARDIEGKCLLVLQHAPASAATGHLPRLKDIEIIDAKDPDAGTPMLVFRLLRMEHRDIFHTLCLDIVTCAENAESEKEAMDVALARTWRWHHLLRGGGEGRLSAEEQKGLIGELLALERLLLTHMSPHDAVTVWRGPLNAPKDFDIGNICIEAKSRRGAASPCVTISSEHQLDSGGIEALFLYVVDLNQAPINTPASFNLPQTAQRIREKIEAKDIMASGLFESRLAAAGFRWEDDYSDFLWIEGESRVYRVSDGFPCLTAKLIAPGVSRVTYSISLIQCEPYLVELNSLFKALSGGNHAD